MADQFKTKTGFCQILQDKIVLTREGIFGDIAEDLIGEDIRKIQWTYLLGGLFLIGLAIKSYVDQEYFSAGLLTTIGLAFGVSTYLSRNNSATAVIPLDNISRIVFYQGIPGITRSRFVVHFTTENQEPRKRLIIMPGTLSNPSEEVEIGKRVFGRLGFLK